MEADAKEPSGVTRGQNAVQVLPPDWSSAARALGTMIDRIDSSRAETQLIVITSDAENAVAAAQAAVEVIGTRAITVVASTASPRASRLLRAQPAHIVTGAPSELVTLLQASALKPAGVRGVVFAWLEPILDTADAQPLETLLGELPKEGARVVLAAELSPAWEALIERYARRARRDPETVDEAATPLSAEYVTAPATARGGALRRLLDALDLPRADLYGRNELLTREAMGITRSLGYGPDSIRLSSGDADDTRDPLVLLELPATREEMRRLAGTKGRKLYAIVQPTQLSSLRGLLGGGMITPVAIVEAAERARGKDAAIRASLRELLTSGDVRREVLALEPLLAEFDGLEIAAAALRMLEQQRPQRPAIAGAPAGAMQRLFLNLGEKDGIRTQEIVGAITAEAGIPGSQIGKVEVRDTHSIVEVGAGVAELVVGKINGAVVRGRKVQARIDAPREERPARSGPPRGGAGAPRGDRPARPFDRDRGERGDRPARPARPFDKGDRPARPGAPRGAAPRGGASRPGSDRPARPSTRDGGTDRPTRPRPRRDDA